MNGITRSMVRLSRKTTNTRTCAASSGPSKQRCAKTYSTWRHDGVVTDALVSTLKTATS